MSWPQTSTQIACGHPTLIGSISAWAGYRRSQHDGPLESISSRNEEIRYLSKWSEFLGSARFVAFGPTVAGLLVSKYMEVLGSGAIPIFPPSEDLWRLGLRPWVHYIPLEDLPGGGLRSALGNYENFQHIALNAVRRHHVICDKMLFDDFEDCVQEITQRRYPRRRLD